MPGAGAAIIARPKLAARKSMPEIGIDWVVCQMVVRDGARAVVWHGYC